MWGSWRLNAPIYVELVPKFMNSRVLTQRVFLWVGSAIAVHNLFSGCPKQKGNIESQLRLPEFNGRIAIYCYVFQGNAKKVKIVVGDRSPGTSIGFLLISLFQDRSIIAEPCATQMCHP